MNKLVVENRKTIPIRQIRRWIKEREPQLSPEDVERRAQAWKRKWKLFPQADSFSRTEFKRKPHDRVYHAVTGLPREIRKTHLHFDLGNSVVPTAEVDLHASYVTILCSWLPDGPEKDSLLTLIQSGSFYESMHAWAAEDFRYPPKKHRHDIKREFQIQVLFGKTNEGFGKQPLFKTFAQKFPETTEQIWEKRQNAGNFDDTHSFAKDLMRAEATLFVDTLLVKCHQRGIPCVVVHDALLVPEPTACDVLGIAEDSAESKWGFVPKFSTER